ncbi:hypothetical protein C8N40_106100 [Pontibacter mucosus]|uniref:Uncharacterized protein n=1 Tax=Pontibacter mucosus TaxID=1649266 RepID=A0A2T5YG94_9BACT|nr:hypothetical protein [Pontibacter mucosus]PTX18301.1 hypothetical protein C8N40_106100 [Pontibacter mucosus]
MTQVPQYTSIASAAFNEYLDNHIELDELIARLREIELQVMHDDEAEEETGKVLWFCFFSGDPFQTTIRDIENDLSDPSHPSSRILLQGIALGLEAGELEVHYSWPGFPET